MATACAKIWRPLLGMARTQELTIQISGAHLVVAIIQESYVHVHLAFFDTTIEHFIKHDDYKSCSF